jgi:hypothetical protein
MSVERSSGRVPWPGEEGAQRLFEAVRGACAGGGDLPSRLEPGLRAALDVLAADPELARVLTVDPYLGGEEALDAQRKWIGRFGDLLRDAATDDPHASQGSSFLAPFLIGGVRFRIARLVLNDETSDLLRLLPGTLEALLSYYFEPGEPRRLTRPALGAEN